MIDKRLTIFSAENKATSCVIALPGRGQLGEELAYYWMQATEMFDTMFVALTPDRREWYPLPISSTNQTKAVSGLARANLVIEEVIQRINKEFHIDLDKIGLVGFSAGGVMANYVASHADYALAGAVCHAGAILEPTKLPEAKNNVPFVLTHSRNDDVFSWEERLLPMEEALLKKGYDIWTKFEMNGHNIEASDIIYGSIILGERMGYSKKWIYNQITALHNRCDFTSETWTNTDGLTGENFIFPERTPAYVDLKISEI